VVVVYSGEVLVAVERLLDYGEGVADDKVPVVITGLLSV
jgi:hypothetical protein